METCISYLKERGYGCSCSKRFYESYDFLPRYHRMTSRLVHFICNELNKTASMTSIATTANVSISTVIRVLKNGFMRFAKTKNTRINEQFYMTGSKMLKPQEFQSLKHVLVHIGIGLKWYWMILLNMAYKWSYRGFNNKIKLLKRVSYSMRNFHLFRNRILHCSN